MFICYEFGRWRWQWNCAVVSILNDVLKIKIEAKFILFPLNRESSTQLYNSWCVVILNPQIVQSQCFYCFKKKVPHQISINRNSVMNITIHHENHNWKNNWISVATDNYHVISYYKSDKIVYNPMSPYDPNKRMDKLINFVVKQHLLTINNIDIYIAHSRRQSKVLIWVFVYYYKAKNSRVLSVLCCSRCWW